MCLKLNLAYWVKESKRQRVKETKSQRDKESKRQRVKETKSQREAYPNPSLKGRAKFPPLMFINGLVNVSLK